MIERQFCRLAPRQVHLWYVFADQATTVDLLKRFEELLSAEERARRDRLRAVDHRRQFVVARALVRTTLSLYADVPPKDWRFRTGAHGKPSIAPEQAGPDLQFNLSHTDGVSVVAVTLGWPLGVDVEHIGRPLDETALARRFFSAAEAAHLEAQHPARRREVFFALWTLKEAYLKARGTGLTLALNKVRFDLGTGRPLVSFDPTLGEEPAGWQFDCPAIGAGHRAALAVRRPPSADLEVVTRNWVPLADEGLSH